MTLGVAASCARSRRSQVWLEFDPTATGKMSLTIVRRFLRRLGEPLGGPEKFKEFVSW